MSGCITPLGLAKQGDITFLWIPFKTWPLQRETKNGAACFLSGFLSLSCNVVCKKKKKKTSVKIVAAEQHMLIPTDFMVQAVIF